VPNRVGYLCEYFIWKLLVSRKLIVFVYVVVLSYVYVCEKVAYRTGMDALRYAALSTSFCALALMMCNIRGIYRPT
jgi:hypothetical protein